MGQRASRVALAAPKRRLQQQHGADAEAGGASQQQWGPRAAAVACKAVACKAASKSSPQKAQQFNQLSQRAAQASTIIGPGAGSLMNVRGQYPDGGRFELDVLLLADVHTPGIEADVSEASTIDVLKTASWYAAHGATPRCLDIMIEGDIQRAHEVGGTLIRSTLPATDNTLDQLRKTLRDCAPHAHFRADRYTGAGCVLGFEQVRVHMFDTRVSAQLSTYHDAVEQARQDAGPSADRIVTDLNRTKWMRFFMGLDPRGKFTDAPYPRKMMKQLSDCYNGNESVLEHVLRVHARVSQRIRKRARKLGLGRAEWLAEQVIATATSTTCAYASGIADSLKYIQADATDYYALLRMLSPNTERADSPCRPDLPGAQTPQCVIVYAGSWHVDHIQRALVRMQGHGNVADMTVGIMMQSAQRRYPERSQKTTDVEDIDCQGDEPCETVGELLARLGLVRG